MTIDELIEEFDFLGTWDEQCRYLIELGEELPDLPVDEKTEENRVRGCQANVWFIPEVHRHNGDTTITIRAKSDARIVDGLIVVLMTLCNGKSPEQILAAPFEEVFADLGLEAHLVPQRRNGLHSMVRRLKDIARQQSTQPTVIENRPPVLAVTERDDTGPRPPLDAAEVACQFPALQRTLEGDVRVIYLDSASSAQKPQVVIDKEREVYEQYYANAYRGVYRYGDRISRELETSREKVRRFIGAEMPEEIIFTSGATMSINLVAQAWGRKFLRPGDEIVLNEMEHHANLVPWQWMAEQTGARLRFLTLTDDGQLALDQLDDVLSDRTRLVAVTAMSNVLGTVPPVAEIVRRAKSAGALVLVDAAQSAPHMPTSVTKDGIDFLAFSGHKLYGPSGTGVLYGRAELLDEMDPFLCGGHMIERVERERFTTTVLPAKFEAGTPAIAQAIALGTAIDFVSQLGFCPIHTHEQKVLRHAWDRLQEIPGLRIYGPDTSHRGAIISFTIEGASAQDLAQLLDLKGVFVRHGHHCAMPLHERLGVPATVRASFGLYNTIEDADTLAEAIHFALHELKLG